MTVATSHRPMRRIAAAAAVIAGLTVLTRVVGFVRTLVFAAAVGTTDLGDMYQTANTIPNIIFEVVIGGALTVVVVPLLAGSDARQAGRIGSALLTWTLVLLVPLGLLLAIFATPVAALLAGNAGPEQVAVAGRMLRVFSAQLPLYGIGLVLTGILHAHHRFTWPVLAPMLSSLVVIGAYLTFAAVEGSGTDIPEVSRTGELILSVGTTLGVAVLSLCLLIPVRSLGLRLRPTFALTRELRRRAVGLAGAAVLTVTAQQIATAVLIRLANGGPVGSLVLFTVAQAVFLLPWSVLAVPLSTPTFPVLAEAAAAADKERFDATVARSTRAVLLAAGLGAAALVGLAPALGQFLSTMTATHPSPALLAATIVAFSPGVIGLSLFSLANRALIAAGEQRRAAAAAAIGWACTIAAAVVVAAVVPQDARVIALAGANSVGMTVLGGCVLIVVARRRGVVALAGFLRTLLVSLGAAAMAGAAGWGLATAVTERGSSVVGALLAGMLAGLAVAGVYLAFVLAGDRGEARAVLGSLIRRMRPARRPWADRRSVLGTEVLGSEVLGNETGNETAREGER